MAVAPVLVVDLFLMDEPRLLEAFGRTKDGRTLSVDTFGEGRLP